MTTVRGFLVLLLGLAVLGLGAWDWRQYQELIRLRASRLTFEGWESNANRLTEAARRIETLRKKLAARAARQKAEAAKAPADAKPDWHSNPEARQLSATIRNYRINAAIDQYFAPLFQKLNLSPEQLAQFKSLIGEKKMAVLDASAAARSEGVATNSPTFRQALLQASSSVDDEIEQAIGPDAFAQFQRYDQTLPERNAVNLVARDLATSATPLTGDQTEQLIQVMAANRPAANSNNLGYILGNATSRISPTDIQAAAGLLNPAQIEAMQQAQAEQQARQKVQQAIYQQMHPPAAPAGKG